MARSALEGSSASSGDAAALVVQQGQAGLGGVGAQDHHPRLAAPKLRAVGHGLQGGEFNEAGADDYGWRVGLIGKLGMEAGLSQVSGSTGRECTAPCPSEMGCGESCKVRQGGAGFVIRAALAEWAQWA